MKDFLLISMQSIDLTKLCEFYKKNEKASNKILIYTGLLSKIEIFRKLKFYVFKLVSNITFLIQFIYF